MRYKQSAININLICKLDVLTSILSQIVLSQEVWIKTLEFLKRIVLVLTPVQSVLKNLLERHSCQKIKWVQRRLSCFGAKMAEDTRVVYIC